jgi:N-acetylneuraminate synthase/sialic acid synthase
MVRDLRRVRVALGDGIKRVYETEVSPIIKMGKKLVAAKDLPAGHAIQQEDLAIKCPGDGLPPYEIDKVIGRVTVKPISVDEDITFDVLNGHKQQAGASG